MFRIVTVFVFIFILGAAFAALADYPAALALSLPGWRISFTPAAALALALLFFAALAALFFLIKLLLAPLSWRGAWQRHKRAHAYKNLTEGLLFACAEDSAAAREKQAGAESLLPARQEPLAAYAAIELSALNRRERLFFAREAEAEEARIAPAAADKSLAALLQGSISGKGGAITSPASGKNAGSPLRLAALRALYEQAKARQDKSGADSAAEQAAAANPALIWASLGAVTAQAQAGQWETALALYENFAKIWRKRAKKDGLNAVEETLDYYKQVLLCGQAAALFPYQPRRARDSALTAHKINSGFAPAATLAAEILFQLNEPRKAEKLAAAAWQRAPHPDLGRVYARAGGTVKPPAKRLERMLRLAALTPENAVADTLVAAAAFHAKDYALARGKALKAAEKEPTAQIFILLAQLAALTGETHEQSRFLAKALTAKAEKAWCADGRALPVWKALSPQSGRLGLCRWQSPAAPLCASAELHSFFAEPKPEQAAEPAPRARENKAEAEASEAQSEKSAPLHGFALPARAEQALPPGPGHIAGPTHINVDNPGVEKPEAAPDKRA